MGIFDKTIWGAENVCVHCGKKIKSWQSYTRPSTYCIHDKCFDAYMRERDAGIPRKRTSTEIAANKVILGDKE